MPCNSAYLNHSAREKESGIVLEFLKEVDGKPFNHEQPSYYGHVATLDEDTDRLCVWLRSHMAAIPSLSLELQLWWQRHQRHDREREAKEVEQQRLHDLKNQALSKLTLEEIDALTRKL
jgi:hypothetical protein